MITSMVAMMSVVAAPIAMTQSREETMTVTIFISSMTSVVMAIAISMTVPISMMSITIPRMSMSPVQMINFIAWCEEWSKSGLGCKINKDEYVCLNLPGRITLAKVKRDDSTKNQK